MTLASPCIGTCQLDAATGYCIGCARTGAEIGAWGGSSAAWRQTVWDKLPRRFEALGVSCRLLPWSADRIRDFVLASLQDTRGSWAMGVVGAMAHFSPAPGEAMQISAEGDAVIARSTGASLRFVIDAETRALTFERGSVPIERARIVLAVTRLRRRPALSDRLALLGPDQRAIAPQDRAIPLFDLGLGRKDARFCVRCPDSAAQHALMRALGRPFPDSLAEIGRALLIESPVRVVETALGRIEISSPIPRPGSAAPLGPHTQLLPDQIALDRNLPAGMDLPRIFLPGAIFCPAV